MQKLIRRTLIAFTAVLLTVVMAAPSSAATVYLKDGSVLEGEIVREGEGFIYLRITIGSIEHDRLVDLATIQRIERDDEDPVDVHAMDDEDDAEVKPANLPADSDGKMRSSPAISGSATRVAFISLEEMVGPFMNADALEHSVELLEGYEVDIVVLRVNSGGGALFEVGKLSDVIQKEIKPNYRVVAWIESAISAAAMTSWVCEEIYMMTEGNIGAATAFTQDGSGRTKAADGENLERILRLAEDNLSARGKRNPLVMRAMQVFMTLSCDIDPDTGEITWYDNDQGQYIVSPEGSILTFNSRDAKKFGVSLGTADSKDELAKHLGLTEWVEVAPEADAYQQEFRENVGRAQVQIQAAQAKLNNAMAAKNAAKAERHLSEIRTWLRRAPSLEIYSGLSDQWFRHMEREIRKIREAQQERKQRSTRERRR